MKENESLLSIIGLPYAMATQHPDSVSRSFTAQDEVKEAIEDLLPLHEGGHGCDEKMVDYEGKLTPYHQMKWIVDEALKMGLEPNKDFLLTPRAPNDRLEDIERQLLVLLGAMAANKLSVSNTGEQAIRYIIYPMSESPYELIALQRRIVRVQRLAEEELGLSNVRPLMVVPLIEDVVKHFHVDKLIEGFHSMAHKECGVLYDHYRVLLGKSDAALHYGHLASSISIVIALSKLYRWSRNNGVRVYPILGVGKPPFRGHLAPESIDAFIEQYSGYYTITIQSALRYDTPRQDYVKVLKVLRSNVGRKPLVLGTEEEQVLIEAARLATRAYLDLLIRVAEQVGIVSRYIPRRRDRVPTEQYGRNIVAPLAFSSYTKSAPRELVLPRAIKFTASLYTMGIPPALMGLGRGLRMIERELGDHALELIIKTLPMLRIDAGFELRFFHPTIARSYVGEKALKLILSDVEEVQELLGVSAESVEEYEKLLIEAHKHIVTGDAEKAVGLIEKAASIRGALG